MENRKDIDAKNIDDTQSLDNIWSIHLYRRWFFMNKYLLDFFEEEVEIKLEDD